MPRARALGLLPMCSSCHICAHTQMLRATAFPACTGERNVCGGPRRPEKQSSLAALPGPGVPGVMQTPARPASPAAPLLSQDHPLEAGCTLARRRGQGVRAGGEKASALPPCTQTPRDLSISAEAVRGQKLCLPHPVRGNGKLKQRCR